MSITYTFPASCPVLALRGVTVTGGVFDTQLVERKLVDVVKFATKVDGKAVIARVAGKPELEAALAAHKADIAKVAADKRAALEAAVPGLGKYETAYRKWLIACAAYDRASERGYPVREGAAMKAADEALQAVFAQNPATRLWREIERHQHADHHEMAAAGNRAAAAVMSGVPIEQAAVAMADEWSAAARRCVDNA